MDEFDFISPLDYRYYKKEFAEFLSENARIRFQARVEAGLAKALANQGVCSEKNAKEIEEACMTVGAAEVYEEEKKTRHDVRALANVIKRKVPLASQPFVHFGATSYDIVDTANALRYKTAVEELVLPSLISLELKLISLAEKTAAIPQIGRTHGQHAEPVTFGFTIAEYVERLGNRIQEIGRAKDNLAGKFSGAVGAYNAASLIVKDPLKLEKDILTGLGLKVPNYSTQVAMPEQTQDLFNALMGAFTVLANFSDDMRHLQRTEISEIAEAVSKGQVGSSTMPHKRNPITFENVKSMWKQFVPRIVTVYMDSLSEHQRDLTNSASQRFLPEFIAALVYSTDKLSGAVDKLIVDEPSIRRNIESSKALIVAEPLYILLAKYGHPDAHEAVRKISFKARDGGKSVLEIAESDSALKNFIHMFSEEEKRLLQNPVSYTGLAEKKTAAVCSLWKKAFK